MTPRLESGNESSNWKTYSLIVICDDFLFWCFLVFLLEDLLEAVNLDELLVEGKPEWVGIWIEDTAIFVLCLHHVAL